MITILISINLIITIMFIMMNHPLSTGSMLLIQTITVSLITGNMNQNTWFSYILFLIMVGGMLVLFMYMTSIASNEKFKMNMKALMLIFAIPMIMFLVQPHSNSIVINNETIPFNQSIELTESLMKYINMPLSMTTMFMMVYLLIALIATVKITNFKQGSIRQMN